MIGRYAAFSIMTSLDTNLTSDSPELELAHPKPAECQAIWLLISVPWRDALSLSQFLEESAYLLTVPLAKDGGMTLWILVLKNSIPDQRAILASCETYRKQALVSEDGGGDVEDVVVHGIASVFCDPKFRGKGYAKVMLEKLAGALRGWQLKEGERCVGSMLYSDIGPRYYASLGWRPVEGNTHIEMPSRESISDLEHIKSLHTEDLQELCEQDESLIRTRLEDPQNAAKEQFIIIPNLNHMLWHHTKEEFVASKILPGRNPLTKGILVGDEVGKRVWAIWTHRFYSDPNTVPSGNVLYILRLVIEDVAPDGVELQRMLKVVFQAAQDEAMKWNLDVVKLWDPEPRVKRMIRRMGIEYEIVERVTDEIASLMWYDEGTGRPEWVANEKYAWC